MLPAALATHRQGSSSQGSNRMGCQIRLWQVRQIRGESGESGESGEPFRPFHPVRSTDGTFQRIAVAPRVAAAVFVSLHGWHDFQGPKETSSLQQNAGDRIHKTRFGPAQGIINLQICGCGRHKQPAVRVADRHRILAAVRKPWKQWRRSECACYTATAQLPFCGHQVIFFTPFLYSGGWHERNHCVMPANYRFCLGWLPGLTKANRVNRQIRHLLWFLDMNHDLLSLIVHEVTIAGLGIRRRKSHRCFTVGNKLHPSLSIRPLGSKKKGACEARGEPTLRVTKHIFFGDPAILLIK